MDTNISKYVLSRRGRKLQSPDDSNLLLGLPKDVPEKTWIEVMQKEEEDLLILDIREEIIENVLEICYEKYIAKQSITFTVHCAALAWLDIINLYFFRHDPGEKGGSEPVVNLPNLMSSWVQGSAPEPSPKDTWAKEMLDVKTDETEIAFENEYFETDSIDYPVISPVSSRCYFEEKFKLEGDTKSSVTHYVSEEYWPEGTSFKSEYSTPEVVEKVTEYLQGESTDIVGTESAEYRKKCGSTLTRKIKHSSLRSGSSGKKSLMSRTGLLKKSEARMIAKTTDEDKPKFLADTSDCRMRSLRLDTEFEIASVNSRSSYSAFDEAKKQTKLK